MQMAGNTNFIVLNDQLHSFVLFPILQDNDVNSTEPSLTAPFEAIFARTPRCDERATWRKDRNDNEQRAGGCSDPGTMAVGRNAGPVGHSVPSTLARWLFHRAGDRPAIVPVAARAAPAEPGPQAHDTSWHRNRHRRHVRSEETRSGKESVSTCRSTWS